MFSHVGFGRVYTIGYTTCKGFAFWTWEGVRFKTDSVFECFWCLVFKIRITSDCWQLKFEDMRKTLLFMLFIVFGSILLNEKGKHMLLEVIRTCPLSQTNLYAAGATGKTSWLKYLFSPRGTILLKLTFSHPKIDGLKYFIDSKGPIRLAGAGDIRSRFLRAGLCQIYVHKVYLYTCFLQTLPMKFHVLGYRLPWVPFSVFCLHVAMLLSSVQDANGPGIPIAARWWHVTWYPWLLDDLLGTSYVSLTHLLGNQTLQMYG